MEKIAETDTSALIKGGLRSLAQLFPFFGSFAQAWNEYDSHTKNKRLDELFKNLQELSALMQDELAKVTQNTEKSVEFAALFEKTVQRVEQELSARKRRLYAQALLNNVAACADHSYDDKLNVIETLDALTESDLKVLNQFPPQASVHVSDFMVSRAPDRIPVDEEQERELSLLLVSFKKLESRGLISETKTYIQSANWFDAEVHWASKWANATFQLIPFGQIFLDALKENSSALANSPIPDELASQFTPP